MRISDLQERVKKLKYQIDHNQDEIKAHATTVDILKQDLENRYLFEIIHSDCPEINNQYDTGWMKVAGHNFEQSIVFVWSVQNNDLQLLSKITAQYYMVLFFNRHIYFAT